MIPRYATPSMTAVWSDEARWSAALQVELAVLDAQAATGEVPANAVAVIRAKAKVDVARINELERTTDHDVVAFVNQLAESVGAEGRWIHHGLTSSDVVDTALALQMRAAAALIDAGLATLLATIIRRERMLQNLSSGLGLHAASRLLTALVDTGMQRDAAYSTVQAAAASARDGNRQLPEVCLADTRMTAALNSAELLALFDHRAATVHAALLVDRLAQLETRG